MAVLDPWAAVAAAVHRSADDRDAWHPEQAITVAEALRASTDGRTGVAVGGPADVVLLDTDPLAGADTGAEAREQAAALRAQRVALTMVAGRVVHRAM